MESHSHPAPGAPAWVRRGTRVFDTRAGRAGVINGIGEPYAVEKTPSCLWLVPPGGGREWQTTLTAVRPDQEPNRA